MGKAPTRWVWRCTGCGATSEADVGICRICGDLVEPQEAAG